MDKSEIFKLVVLIVGPLIGIIGGAYAIIKIFFRYKSKILFITNCQILHKEIWGDMVTYYDINKHGAHDHAFRPMVLLPIEMKKYISIPNGGKVILENINTEHENSLKIIAEVFWIPNEVDDPIYEGRMLKWGLITHPVFSLILRRYFGLERPMYQDEDKPKGPWEKALHYSTYLDPLNKSEDEKGKIMKWAVSDKITFRYFNPDKPGDNKYDSEAKKENFIEYCGFSISLRKRSWMHIERE